MEYASARFNKRRANSETRNFGEIQTMSPSESGDREEKHTHTRTHSEFQFV